MSKDKNKHGHLKPLPADQLPECWNDDTRMNALFAPFRSKSVNPKDWESKLNFWKNTITKLCLYNKCCTFSFDDINSVLKRDGRSVGCLSTVVDELYRNGEFQCLNKFSQTPQQNWSNWAVDVLVKKPFVWSFNKIKHTIVSPPGETIVYVNVEAVKNMSGKLLTCIKNNYFNKLINLDDLVGLTEVKDFDITALKLCVLYLRRNGKILIQETVVHIHNEEKGVNLIKLVDENEKNPSITTTDIAVFKLERNEQHLIKNLEDLEEERDKLVAEAKAYLTKGKKLLATNSLRKKRTIDAQITRRATVLNNVQALLGRVGDAQIDAGVASTYRSGTAALKEALSSAGLTEDSVDDLVAEVQDIFEMHDDIQSTLKRNLSPDQLEDLELEEELEDLLKSETPPTPPPKPTTLEDSLSDIEQLEKRLNALRGSPSTENENEELLVKKMLVTDK